MATATFLSTMSIPEFKAATGSSKINLHQSDTGKLFFSTDKITDDCKVSSKLDVDTIKSTPADDLKISRCKDDESGKEFFLMHIKRSEDHEVIFSI